jgi:glycosyltransferase involved in cell wall biosynthesis
MAGISISLIMPVLNEEAGLETAVSRSLAALEKHTEQLELIIIDDGSTDQTGPIADEFARVDARIRVIHNARNENYGVSLRRGIAEAKGEWILHNGADLPLAPEDIWMFLPLLPDADVVIARRTSREAHAPWRKLTSWTNNLLLRILFRPSSGDLNFTQFYRRSWVQGLALRSTSPAFITPEIILRAEKTGRRVRELPVEFRRRTSGKAHFGRLDDILWTVRDMLSLRAWSWAKGWYV